MKANELMIGDWVISNDLLNRPARYAGIFTEHTPLKGQPYRRLRCMWPGDIEGADVPEERVLPILLTTEILEKNGFEKIGTSYQYIARPGLYIRLIGISNKHLSLQIASRYIGLDYVHEHQHALRLCKIEKEIVL